MPKPIYFSLPLLVLCLINEAYGNHHHTVTHIRLPSRKISRNIGPYDSSSTSSSTTGAEANGVVDAAATSESAATPESAATSLSPSSSLKKSLNSLGYDRNRGLGLNSKSLSSTYNGQKPNMDSNDLNIEQIKKSMIARFRNYKPPSSPYYRNNEIDRQNSITSGILNNKPLNGSYNINNQNDNTLEDLNTMKRQNSKTSDVQDFPNLTETETNPLARLIVRQKSLFPPSYENISQRISVGNDNSSIMKVMNSIKNPLYGQNIIFKSFRRCCINDVCRMLQDGEKCSIDNYSKNKQPNNPMFTTSSNGENGLNDMMSKSIDQSSFNSLGGDIGDFQKTGKPKNRRSGSMRYSTIIPSIGSSDGTGSYVMPQKRKPTNYQHSDPIDLSEDEANEIRNQVLQKSNLYRAKYKLDPFTLDDQLNNCAQDWANQMVKLQIFDHRKDNVYGENLFSKLGSNNLGEDAVDSWYNEITKFNIAGGETELVSNVATHHLTQLLWKSSTKLGVGVSKNPNGMYNVVANYDPSGNVMGFFKVNLPEIKQEDIEEAMELQNAQMEAKQKQISWSSSSIPSLQSNWNYESYYDN